MFGNLSSIAQQIASGMTSGTLFIALMTIGIAILGYMLIFSHVNHSTALRVGLGGGIVAAAAVIAAAF